jgi:NAD+--dinitrogen-reductase ADP-D-ribosyltransferase
LEIQGTHHTIQKFFDLVKAIEDPEVRGAKFHDFMDVIFQLHNWERESSRSSQKSLRNNYLKFLRGWLFDSNSIAGAVLKGWVESRLGLIPTFHREIINSVHSETYYQYLVDRMTGSTRTSAVLSQLDLLYEYVQHELLRRFPGKTHFTLYRGIYDFSEHQIVSRLEKNHYVLRLNNLNSFTNDFERAWEFGNRVIKTKVPLTKIFFMAGLLPKALLRGEGELMIIGGEFDIRVLTG